MSVQVEAPIGWHYDSWSGGCPWELLVELCRKQSGRHRGNGVTVEKVYQGGSDMISICLIQQMQFAIFVKTHPVLLLLMLPYSQFFKL